MNKDEDDDGSMSHQQHLNAARTATPAKDDVLRDVLRDVPPEDDEVGNKQKRLEMSVLSANSADQDLLETVDKEYEGIPNLKKGGIA